MKIFEDIKKKQEEYNSWRNRYERSKDTDLNKKARKNFQKNLTKMYANQKISEEQEAILFTQSYEELLLKNPTAAKFPGFDEYEVEKSDAIYVVKGYCDSTNAYGAQVRDNYELEVYKHDDVWTCITDVADMWTYMTKILTNVGIGIGIDYIEQILISIFLIVFAIIVVCCLIAILLI